MIDLTGIKHFTLEEILKAGSTDYTEVSIPVELHKNIIPTIKLLDELREVYGKPIIPICTYRDEEHNERAGGADDSLHKSFNAIDFTVANHEDLKILYRQLDAWDTEGLYGLGKYDTFIHVDTRGLIGRKSPARWRG